MKNYYNILNISEFGNFQEFQNQMAKLQNSLYKKQNRAKDPVKQAELAEQYEMASEFLSLIKSQEELLEYNNSIAEVVVEEVEDDYRKILDEHIKNLNNATQKAAEEKLQDYITEFDAGNYNVAIALADSLTNIDSGNKYYWTLLAKANQAANQLDQAGYAYRKAFSCEGEKDEVYLFESYSWYLVKFNSSDASVAEVGKMYSKYPNNRYIANSYGCLLKNNKRELEAIDLFIKLQEERKEDHIISNLNSALFDYLDRVFAKENQTQNHIYYTEEQANHVKSLLDKVSQVSTDARLTKEYNNIKKYGDGKVWLKFKYTKIVLALAMLSIGYIFILCLAFIGDPGTLFGLIISGLALAGMTKLVTKLRVTKFEYNQIVHGGKKTNAETVENVCKWIFKICKWLFFFWIAVLLFALSVFGSSSKRY